MLELTGPHPTTQRLFTYAPLEPPTNAFDAPTISQHPLIFPIALVMDANSIKGELCIDTNSSGLTDLSAVLWYANMTLHSMLDVTPLTSTLPGTRTRSFHFVLAEPYPPMDALASFHTLPFSHFPRFFIVV